jgi:hypothetical protein
MPELTTHSTSISNTLPPSLYAVPPDAPPAPSTSRFTTTVHDLPGVAIPRSSIPPHGRTSPSSERRSSSSSRTLPTPPLYGSLAVSFTNWSWSTTTIGRTGWRESRQPSCEPLSPISGTWKAIWEP